MDGAKHDPRAYSPPESAPHTSDLTIHTDSLCSVKWLDGSYARKTPHVIATCALIEQTIEGRRAGGVETRLVYVKGHAGEALNERADLLASAAARRGSGGRSGTSERPRWGAGAD